MSQSTAQRQAKYQAKLRAEGKWNIGEKTLICKRELCGKSFTYVKTVGRQRLYCDDYCRCQAANECRKKRTSQFRQCACGSTNVARTGKPVCSDCKKDWMSTGEGTLSHASSRRHTLRLYNITQDDFDRILARQGGRCAICRTDDPGRRGIWCIDHDHTCCPDKSSCGNCVRGLLCLNCNVMVGLALDNPVVLAHAAHYVRQHRKERNVA
jgi:hypothetical protein